MTKEKKEPSAMDCWHFIAPLIPIVGRPECVSIYVKAFHAFQLLEQEEKENADAVD